MRALGHLLSIALISFCVGSLNATTINVPADQPTIQAGINAAVDGDTVLVADGTYTGDGNRDIDFLGKAILVMSENGAENCVIDCEGSYQDEHRGFYFHSGEDSTSVLQGFTIRNGCAIPVGVILCDSSSPTIRSNMIVGNILGGINCSNSSANITYNTISNNMNEDEGGGIICNSSSPTIIGNIITGNHVDDGVGGGIYCVNYSYPLIANNTIMENGSMVGGGGIHCRDSSPTITGNNISGNRTGGFVIGYGGGIYCEHSSPTITGNTLMGNTAFYGGGIYCEESSPTITGNTISGNSSATYGGGIFCLYSYPTITGNTITGNVASWEGGGISCGSGLTITNTIFWNNDPDQISGNPTVMYSNIEGNYPGEGNIDENPMFVLSDQQDYRLLWGSPCIDTGDPTLSDLDGTRSDMGAHYFNQDDHLTLYVTPDDLWTSPGGQLGVTYTAINRWDSPESFWCLSQVLLPSGSALDVLEPEQFTLQANTTAQIHINHNVPTATPTGVYEYWSQIGMPPDDLYDEDSFKFWVVE